MKTILARTKEFLRSEDGPTTVEYAVMLALIVAVAIGAIGVIGKQTKEAFDKTKDAMTAEGFTGS